MRALFIGFVACLATVNAAQYGPIPHPDCPFDEDPFNPTHLPVPGDCTKFYKCEGGLAYLMDCPARLHWSILHNRCEYPGLAIPKCKTPNINLIQKILLDNIAEIKEDPPSRHPKCPLDDDPQNPIQLADPKDCTKFLKCANGYAIPQACPAGLHWNDRAKICDWPENAKCVPKKFFKNFLKIDNDIVDTPPPIEHKECPKVDIPGKPKHLPYPNDCTKFYKCSYGYAYTMNCPSGEHFGVEINRCDWPNVAKCDPNIEPEPSTTVSPPTTPELTTTTETSENTTTTERNSTTTERISTTTSEPLPPGIDCSNVPHGTLYPHPDDCQKFVHCTYGNGVIKHCPGILHFSPTLLVCQWPEIAGCTVEH